MIYAGIGSRKTPSSVCSFMSDFAYTVAKHGWTLRSGHADGADLAFERGCIQAAGTKEIYLPWASFNSFHHRVGKTYIDEPSPEAFNIASAFHPLWNSLSYTVKKLMARNTHQIAGLDLNTPADLVVCWTTDGQALGGTGQAIRIANHLNIPVFNLQLRTHQIELEAFINKRNIS